MRLIGGLVLSKQIMLLLTEMQHSGSVLVLFYTLMILGKHCVLPGTLPRPQTSEEGGCRHHEQHSPNLQHKVSDDQERIDEGSQT